MEYGCKLRFFYKQNIPQGVKNRSVNSFQARWSHLFIEKYSKRRLGSIGASLMDPVDRNLF
jgi:hypothetical protein